jgi:ribosomal protein S18 acetylase RimI-like enzyme
MTFGELTLCAYSKNNSVAASKLLADCGMTLGHMTGGDIASPVTETDLFEFQESRDPKSKDSRRVWVACDLDSEVVGAIVFEGKADRLVINYIAVSPFLRKQGIGRYMLTLLFSKTGMKRYGSCLAYVSDENTGAIEFLDRCGFSVVPNKKELKFEKHLSEGAKT